jgi:hypothetical protein
MFSVQKRNSFLPAGNGKKYINQFCFEPPPPPTENGKACTANNILVLQSADGDVIGALCVCAPAAV